MSRIKPAVVPGPCGPKREPSPLTILFGTPLPPSGPPFGYGRWVSMAPRKQGVNGPAPAPFEGGTAARGALGVGRVLHPRGGTGWRAEGVSARAGMLSIFLHLN